MKLNLSRKEMLEIRRRHGGLESVNTGCTIEQTDGVSLDELLEDDMRQRYLALLDSGPEQLLDPKEIAPACWIGDEDAELPRGWAVVEPPAGCRRVLALRLEGWERPVRPQAQEKLTEMIQRQDNPYTRAVPQSPVAVMLPLGKIAVAPLPEDRAPELRSVVAAFDTGRETYSFDEGALGLIIPLLKPVEYD